MRFLSVMLLLLLLVAPAALSAQEDTPERPLIGAWDACPTPENLSGEIRLGIAASLTEAPAIYGIPQARGVEIALDEINASGYLGDATLMGIYEDSLGSPEDAIAAMEKLVNQDEVVAVIGPSLSTQALAADPIAMEKGVVVVGITNAAEGLEETLGDFYFRVGLPESKVIPNTLLESINLLGIETVAIMHSDNDQFTTSGYNVFIDALAEAGVEVVLDETFRTGDLDFNAQLTNIIAEEPDAILISALAAEIVPLLEQARNLGYTGPILGGNGFNAPGIATEETGAGENANGVIVGAAWNIAQQNAISQAFSEKYEAEFDVAADQFAVQAYTAAWLLASAMRCTDSAASDDIRAYLTDELRDFETPLGDFSFDDNRQPQHDIAVQVIQDGQYLILTEALAAELFEE